MTATIHFFDEFLLPPEEYNVEYRHQKRVRLEPLVFNVLRQRYGALWREHWLNYTPPVGADRCVVIIERRIHENLELLLHNVAYYAPTCTIAIVCSDVNFNYCRAITAPHEGRVKLLCSFDGSPHYEQARQDYNALTKSPSFYRSLGCKEIYIAQTDSYLRKPLPAWLSSYEFIASPAAWDKTQMIGGISFRNCAAAARICEEFPDKFPSEDVYFTEGAKALNLRIPTYEGAIPIFCESCLYDDPIGVHQWWTYFNLTNPAAERVFHALLTCEVNP